MFRAPPHAEVQRDRHAFAAVADLEFRTEAGNLEWPAPNKEATMTKEQLSLSRRQLIQTGSAALATGVAGLSPAFAKAPIIGTQAPYFYRFKLGNAEATIVSDGPLPLGDPHKNFLGLTKDEIARQLNDNYLPVANAVLEQNALIVNTGDKLVLFDTGMGSAKDFGPTTGKLMASIKAAGIDPKDIDAVVM